MKKPNVLISVSFMTGLIFGAFLQLIIFDYVSENLKLKEEIKEIFQEKNSKILYEQKLAEKLNKKVKILCWVFTHPPNHRTKVPAVRETWGPRCDKLLFMSVEADPEYPDIIALPIEDGREHLWYKTKLAMKYIYEKYLNDYDWFMRADDDSYVIMENLRQMLYRYNPKTALYIGSRYTARLNEFPGAEEGFQPGAGHLYSKKAFIKFMNLLKNDPVNCRTADGENDDVYEGKCLKYQALFIDGLDDIGQRMFFSAGIKTHLTKDVFHFWYWDLLWTNSTQGSLNCCSDVMIHTTPNTPSEMQQLEYLIYHVHPFGIQKNLTEVLPRKFSFNEVIKMSDKKSSSIYYKDHNITHHFDPDEKY